MKTFSSLDWRLPKSPPWTSPGSNGKHPANPFEVMYMSHTDHMERRRSPPGPLKADKGKGVHRVPSLEELGKYGAGSSSRAGGRGGGGGGFRKDEEYHRSKELDPMEYAWLIQKGFVSSIKYTRRMKTKKSSLSMQNFTVSDTGKRSKENKKTNVDNLNSLHYLDLATGWDSSRHVLVEEVISNVFKKAEKSADLSKLRHLGLPPSYLPTIAEAMQAEHLAEFKHLDLANTGSLGQKSLEFRRLVESRLPTFLRSNILPYNYTPGQL